ncbi:response regulator [Sulfurimonas sp.]|uniref:response regulator n=1 Tax=Sulfurimonas sp. TaxID=2022749 RepID=UPI0039E5C9E5
MNEFKILIVEDEPIVALDIERTLLKLGYSITDSVTNYDDAIASVASHTPDIIFMDISLANSKSGIEIVQEIKKTKDIPIIYLTAFSDDDTMQKAIQTNPVNYLLKPFKREELKSSILLSIYKIKNDTLTTINDDYTHIGSDYYYDEKNNNLYYKDRPILLGTNETKLLQLLVEANGQIITLSSIEDYIWPEKNMSGSAFRTLVYRLRSKLEFKLIETIPSFGYKLNK